MKAKTPEQLAELLQSLISKVELGLAAEVEASVIAGVVQSEISDRIKALLKPDMQNLSSPDLVKLHWLACKVLQAPKGKRTKNLDA
jgi:hypothetical protein